MHGVTKEQCDVLEYNNENCNLISFSSFVKRVCYHRRQTNRYAKLDSRVFKDKLSALQTLLTNVRWTGDNYLHSHSSHGASSVILRAVMF